MTSAVSDKIAKTGRRLGRPDILFWCLPWLMFLLVLGTVAQKTIGLYDAQHQFFSSFVFFIYGVPLPGGYSVIAVMAINLVCKFIFSSQWTWQKAGIHLTHVAVIILLIGGLLTAFTMQEGYMALKEGEQKSTITDYHQRTVFIQGEDGDGQRVVVNFDDFKRGKTDDLPLSFKVKPLKLCRHTQIKPMPKDSRNYIGAASMIDLQCVEPLKDSEQNRAGMVYEISGASDADNGIYVAFEGRQTQDEITDNGGNIHTITLAREERQLPFSVSLRKFNRDVYPGTDMARDYESMIDVIDGHVKWPAHITMNEPLRYKGYTLYQASTWIDDEGAAVSVLSVVKNTGWIFPYLSGVLLFIGLFYHLIVMIRKRR